MAIATALAIATAPALRAQEPPPETVEDSALLDEVALDNLVAPVALYPDALLAQVLVAATYPLEVVKADRWVTENDALEGDARVEAADGEGWDPAVAVLAAGFPDLVQRMAADLNHTETLGNAVLAQTDDVMDAVQRQRARAAELGNLESNQAQTVTVEGDSISIAPADPEVVYVPAYDPNLAYTQAASAAPVVVTDPDDDSYSSGDLLATGVIAFGAGMLVNEIFDDDDDWDDYWRGPPRIDWNDGNFYPRPGVNIDGDVNIDVDRGNLDLDRGPAFRPDRDRADNARDKIAERRDGNRPATRPARDGSRDAARERLAERTGGGGGAAATLRERAGNGGGGAAALRERAGSGGGGAAALRERTRESNRAGAGGGGLRAAVTNRGGGEARPARPARPNAASGGSRPRPKLGGGGGNRGAALSKRSGSRDRAASARGGRSGGGGGGRLNRR
jgi:hypothetical protein